MRTLSKLSFLLFGAAVALPSLVQAADTVEAITAPELAITPTIQLGDLHAPRFPSRNFEIGLVVGDHANKYYGFSRTKGIRAAYRITEDFYVEGQIDKSMISDKRLWVKNPAGSGSSAKYLFQGDVPEDAYMLTMGYEGLLPGELHVFRHYDFLTSGYAFGGIGKINFNGKSENAFRFGGGSRLFLTNSIVLRSEVTTDFFTFDKPSPKLKKIQRKGAQSGALSVGVSFIF